MSKAIYSDDERRVIKQTVEELGNKKMKEGCHGFRDYSDKTIREAARLQLNKPKSENNAAISVIGVVLGANRNWEKVVRPNLDSLKDSQKYGSMTFEQLEGLLIAINFEGFKEVWGHRDEKKYNTLKELVAAIRDFAQLHPGLSDFDLMSQWARNAKLENRRTDILGSIRNVGIATFHHLRLTFGVDTVKPDQRVMEVLQLEFGKKLSPSKAILEVEEIARIAGQSVAMIDQIFVKYGSGYLKKNSSCED